MFPNRLYDLDEISHCVVCDEVTVHPEEICSEDCYNFYVAVQEDLIKKQEEE